MSDKVIVFDLGKVIFDYDLNLISKSLSKFSNKNPSLFNNMEQFLYSNKDLFSKYEKGLISSIDFYRKMVDILFLEDLSFENFSNIWNNIFIPKQDVIDLIKSLSDKYTISLLSNTNELHFDWLYKNYKTFFDKNFKKLFLSYEMKERKPEENIYTSLIKFYNINSKNIFFTDDNQENIEVAKKLGIQAFVYQNIDKLKEDLNVFGITL
jgi:putative hydrolase of the HAD superfamily